MHHSSAITPQFFVTAPQSCPYLTNRRERKLFTALQGSQAEELNNALSKQGFRRSQNVLYRPSCSECSACLSARIRTADFVPKRGHRRVLRKNAQITRTTRSAWATEEQFDLFRAYLEARHATGGMADMDMFEFAAMVEETPVRTRLLEYSDAEGKLAAVCLSDVLDDGLSMVYSFFDPELSKRSLGTYVILDHINLAREIGLQYVYLGYWVPGSDKMGYKADFPALEVYSGGMWQDLEDPAQYSSARHPVSTESIARQVAQIELPDAKPTPE